MFVGIIGITIVTLLGIQYLRDRAGRKIVQPVISEIQAHNIHGLKDESGRTADWIEIWNPSTEAINLEGWSLTDDFRKLHKWTFPAISLVPGKFLVVFATGKNRTNALGVLHTNFQLDPQGEYLALVAPRGDRVTQEFLPKYPKQIADTSFGLSPEAFHRPKGPFPLRTAELTYLQIPSPGAANADELLGVVENLKLSRHRGLIEAPFPLTISTKTYDAEIRYTIDGTLPTPKHGIRYRGPLKIDRTTTIRAAAFRPGFKGSEVVTETYVFPSDVIAQSNTGHPETWGVRNEKPVPADYEMDPEVLNNELARDQAIAGLKSLPSVSLVVAPEDLFGGERGIYAHPLEHGETWERAASFEWIRPDGHSDMQADCGVRIQGGWSRRPEESPKHSFRVLFRKEYGAASIKHKFFGDGGPNTFHELILRAGCNNSWLHWSATERRRGELLRDEWMRDTLRAMGSPSPRGTFVHLYLNGLYWGIYNLVERPDANFLAEHFGGSPKDFDSRNANNVLSGDTVVWDRLFKLANAGVTSSATYAQVGELLDIPSFIDFIIVHLYGGSGDIDRASNWYAARLRRSGGRYVFIMWDGERSLEDVNADALGLNDDQCPTGLFQKLRMNAEFRRAFSDRVEELTKAGGLLAPDETAARYRTLAGDVETAMICESARWGDYRRDVHPYKEGPYELYTVKDHWLPEVKRLLSDYFPKRTARFREQLRGVGLFTD